MARSPSMGLSYILLPIAAANKPPNAPAKVVDPKNRVKRFCDSQRLYHIAVCGQVNHLASIQALGKLTHHIEASGEHAALTQAQEEAGGKQTAIGLHEALAHHDETEEEHAKRHPPLGAPALENNVGRNLEQNVGHEEDGQRRIELRASKVQVRFQVEQAGIADIHLVQERHQVHDTQERHHVEVNPPEEPSLRRVGWADYLLLRRTSFDAIVAGSSFDIAGDASLDRRGGSYRHNGQKIISQNNRIYI
jgi:hypothetical protein